MEKVGYSILVKKQIGISFGMRNQKQERYISNYHGEISRI